VYNVCAEVLESNPTNKITLRNAGQVCMQLEMDRDDRYAAPHDTTQRHTMPRAALTSDCQPNLR
jgi:hypothetical protein